MNLFGLAPLLLFLLCFLGLWAASCLGAWLRRGAVASEARRTDVGLIVAATLTLLGLLIGFTFSMAASRYDQRKNLEEAEANAIGTEYLRADLLAPADRTTVRDLLRKYVELRVRFYLARESELAGINAETARMQAELWSAVAGPAMRQPDPVMALVVSGMNDVINAQGYTQAAWWNRIPATAAVLIVVIGLFCCVLVGYSLHSIAPRNGLLVILPLFVATAFTLIADIDAPRRGLIQVAPTNLLSLLDSIRSP
jgi:hypothetical protein